MYRNPPLKQRKCDYCSEEFTAKKISAYAWQEYCPKCTKDRVWLKRFIQFKKRKKG